MTNRTAAIFDLDGTLVDSLLDIADALNETLVEHGRDPASLENVRQWIGDGLAQLCHRAWPEAEDARLAEFAREAGRRYQERCLVRTKAYPNIRRMLELLREAGVPLAVVSNKPEAMVRQVLEGLSLSEFFAEVRGYTAEEDKKPSPHHALAAAKRLQVPTSRVIFVGDSPVDIETARRAGMKSIGVTWGFRSRQELAAAGADLMADEPLEILHLILQEGRSSSP